MLELEKILSTGFTKDHQKQKKNFLNLFGVYPMFVGFIIFRKGPQYFDEEDVAKILLRNSLVKNLEEGVEEFKKNILKSPIYVDGISFMFKESDELKRSGKYSLVGYTWSGYT